MKTPRVGNSTFYATGCEPGFVGLNLPTALLAGAGVIETYRMDEYALDLDVSYPIWEVPHESMGFGKPDNHVPTRIAVGKVNNDCGHRSQLTAMHDERPVVSVQYFAAVTSTPWPDSWPRPAQPGKGGMVFRIEGNPNMTLALHLDPAPGDSTNPGVAETVMAAVNAIPAIIDAAPGLLSAPLAGPSIVTRQIRR